MCCSSPFDSEKAIPQKGRRAPAASPVRRWQNKHRNLGTWDFLGGRPSQKATTIWLLQIFLAAGRVRKRASKHKYVKNKSMLDRKTLPWKGAHKRKEYSIFCWSVLEISCIMLTTRKNQHWTGERLPWTGANKTITESSRWSPPLSTLSEESQKATTIWVLQIFLAARPVKRRDGNHYHREIKAQVRKENQRWTGRFLLWKGVNKRQGSNFLQGSTGTIMHHVDHKKKPGDRLPCSL